ncbi:MAG: auxin efflux carrier, partial [Linnemannia gamsii]
VSKLNLYFLTPCLLFTKMASTITWSQFKAFWPIPLIYTLYSFINWVTAKIGSRLLGFSRDEEKFVIASVFFSNTNSLPMALVQSLAMSAAGVRLLRDEMDTKEMVMARGISYILFYAIFGNLVRWSYGFSLLVPKDEEEEGVMVDKTEGISASAGGIQGLNNASSCMTTTDNNLQTQRNQYPSSSSPPSASHSSSPNPPTTTIVQKFASLFNKLRQVLTPPLLTALIALVVGLVPALHQFFMSPESKFYTFVIHPLEECGEGAIPLILICLGAQVVHLASTSSPASPRPRRCNRVSPVGYAIIARTLIAPLICLPFILFHPSSISPLLTTDPVFRMVLVLIAAAPTAINLTQLCQIKGFFEREMASLLFWSYCVLGVPLVLGWSLVGLWAAGRG